MPTESTCPPERVPVQSDHIHEATSTSSVQHQVPRSSTNPKGNYYSKYVEELLAIISQLKAELASVIKERDHLKINIGNCQRTIISLKPNYMMSKKKVKIVLSKLSIVILHYHILIQLPQVSLSPDGQKKILVKLSL